MMTETFITFAIRVHKLTLALCMMLFAVMAASTLATVVLRYSFDTGFLWLQDLTLYAFGLLAILSLPCAIHADRHVRVDIFRAKQSFRRGVLTDRFSFAAFLAPVFIMLLVYAAPELLTSIRINEASPQIGGLPWYFVVKAGMPISAVLMLLQGGALIVRAAHFKHPETDIT